MGMMTNRLMETLAFNDTLATGSDKQRFTGDDLIAASPERTFIPSSLSSIYMADVLMKLSFCNNQPIDYFCMPSSMHPLFASETGKPFCISMSRKFNTLNTWAWKIYISRQ